MPGSRCSFVTNARKGTFRESLQRKNNQIQRAIYSFPLAPNTASTGIPESLTKSSATVEINALWKVKALFDSGISERFIHPSLVEAAAITIHPSSRTVSMATSAFSTKVTGYCIVNLTSQGWVYTKAFIYLYYQDSTLTLSWDSRSSHSMKALLLIMVVRNHPCLSLVYIKYSPASTVCNPDCRLSSHRH